MIINIKPIENESLYLDCFQGLLASISLWATCDYEFIFTGEWGFSFKTNGKIEKETLGSRLSANKYFINDILEKYQGIKVKWYKNINEDEGLKIIENELKLGSPVVISVNGYWCPWHARYKIFEDDFHYTMIVGFDKEKQVMYINDHTMKLYKKEFYLSDFRKSFLGECVIFKITNKSLNIDWKDIVNKQISRLINEEKNVFDEMRKFADEVELYYNKDIEIKGFESEIQLTPLFNTLLIIQEGRFKYSRVLTHLNNKYSIKNLNIIAEQLKEAGSIWSTIRGLLLKSCFISNTESLVKKVATKIRCVADLEENVAKNLIIIMNKNYNINDVVSDNYSNIKTNNIVFSKTYECICINLKDYLNNNGIGDPNDEKCSSDFSGIGKYFFYKDNFPKNNILNYNKLQFQIAYNDNYSFDNISCNEQLITLPQGYYNSIAILGCSELGSFSDYVNLKYSDETTEKILLQLSALELIEPLFGETIMLTGQYGKIYREGVFVSRLFSQHFKLNERKAVKELNLPYCPNMHIFAITLCK